MSRWRRVSHCLRPMVGCSAYVCHLMSKWAQHNTECLSISLYDTRRGVCVLVLIKRLCHLTPQPNRPATDVAFTLQYATPLQQITQKHATLLLIFTFVLLNPEILVQIWHHLILIPKSAFVSPPATAPAPIPGKGEATPHKATPNCNRAAKNNKEEEAKGEREQER